jgi:tRNA-binding protein
MYKNKSSKSSVACYNNDTCLNLSAVQFQSYVSKNVLLKSNEHKYLKYEMESKTNFSLLWSDFEKVDMRVGTITAVSDFPEARKSAYQLTIDFGREFGIKKSSAQITKRYQKEDLIGKQIIAVVNFPKKQIGKFHSECLVLGSVGEENDIVLLTSDLKVENGLRIG